VKPLVGWIWFGCLILAVGTIVALWPSADRRKSASGAPADAALEPASAVAND
jgi:cytochrome c biogenesis factor